MKSAVPPPVRTAATVRSRIQSGGERLWRLQDFHGLPPAAVAKTLSRLARGGAIERLSKGIYFCGRPTPFGPSRPNPAALQRLAAHSKPLFPAGLAAANLLGFTTQNPARAEVSTTATSLPRRLLGAGALVHTRRPEAWSSLTESDAAVLDFLRRRGDTSELTASMTVRRTLALLAESGRYQRLLMVAYTEPPRVRAMLGAIGQRLRKPTAVTDRLRTSLNPLSRFDFGALSGLPNARSWQAK